MNSQSRIFDSLYTKLEELITEYVSLVIVDVSKAQGKKQEIVNYLVSSYGEGYSEEVIYIMDSLDIELSLEEKVRVRESVNDADFMSRNYTRLLDILNTNEDKLQRAWASYPEQSVVEDFVLEQVAIIERLTVSELHMAVEQASVHASQVLEMMSNSTLYKTWNSVLDSKTCPTCVAMHGVEVPVSESFMVAGKEEFFEDLSYVGGNVPYAHPRCRCWLTYRKESRTI